MKHKYNESEDGYNLIIIDNKYIEFANMEKINDYEYCSSSCAHDIEELKKAIELWEEKYG